MRQPLTPIEPTLRYLKLLHELALSQAEDLQSAMDRIMEPSPVGSPTDSDVKQVMRSVRSDDRRELWSQAQFACMHMAVNAADHLRSVALLLSQPSDGVPIYAHATVARVAIESAAGAAHILDRTAPFDVRFARGIALLINDSEKAKRTADRVPGNPYMVAPGPEAHRRHQELLRLISRAKIETIGDENGRPKGVRVFPQAPEVPIKTEVTQLVSDRFSDMPAIYGLLSGVIHGMPHMLGTNARVIDRQGRWDGEPLDVGASVLAAVSAAHAVFEAHAWHRGREDDPALAAMQTRTAAVDQAMLQFGRQQTPRLRPMPVTWLLASNP